MSDFFGEIWILGSGYTCRAFSRYHRSGASRRLSIALSSPPNTLPEGTGPLNSAVPQTPPARDPVWSFWDVMMMVVVVFGCLFLFTGVIGRAAGLSPKAHEITALTVKVSLASELLAYVVVLGFLYQLVVHHYRRRFSEAVRWIAPARATWVGFVIAGVGLSFLVALLSKVLPTPPVLPIERYFQDPVSAWAMVVFGVSFGPLMEELFYRGFLYPVLARRLGVALAAVLTAAAFALMHSSQLANAWAPLLILFLVGLVLTITRIVTGSVVPGFLIHVGYNAAIFAVIYVSTDGFRHLEKLLQP
jgi:membrane protease YdiL (CAAX protease family)